MTLQKAKDGKGELPALSARIVSNGRSGATVWPWAARSKLCALIEPLRAGATNTKAIRRNAVRASISCHLVTQVNGRTTENSGLAWPDIHQNHIVVRTQE